MDSTNSRRTVVAGPKMANRLSIGALGGLVSGAVFAALICWSAGLSGRPVLSPFRLIATVVQGGSPAGKEIWLGMIVHIVLSLLFGLLFAALSTPWASPAMTAWAALVFGGLLYVVDFQLLSRFVARWAAFLQDTNQAFQLAVHLVFGAILSLFLMPFARESAPGRPDL